MFFAPLLTGPEAEAVRPDEMWRVKVRIGTPTITPPIHHPHVASHTPPASGHSHQHHAFYSSICPSLSHLSIYFSFMSFCCCFLVCSFVRWLLCLLIRSLVFRLCFCLSVVVSVRQFVFLFVRFRVLFSFFGVFACYFFSFSFNCSFFFFLFVYLFTYSFIQLFIFFIFSSFPSSFLFDDLLIHLFIHFCVWSSLHSAPSGTPAVIILDQLNCLASMSDIFDVSQLEGNTNRWAVRLPVPSLWLAHCRQRLIISTFLQPLHHWGPGQKQEGPVHV